MQTGVFFFKEYSVLVFFNKQKLVSFKICDFQNCMYLATFFKLVLVYLILCVWADSVCSYLHSTQLHMTRVMNDVVGGSEGNSWHIPVVTCKD